MMKLRVLNGPKQGQVFSLEGGRFTIGRDKENSLVLEEGVSRQHAAIVDAAGIPVIEDLHSTNGVRVNGQKISDPQPLKDGDHVGIGNYVLLVTAADDAAAAALAAAPEAAGAVAARPLHAGWLVAALVPALLAAAAAWWWMQPGRDAGTTTAAAPAATLPAAVPAEAAPPAAVPAVEPAVEPAVPAVEAVPTPVVAVPAPVADSSPVGAESAAPPPMAVIASEPPGATVSVDGEPRGVTPAFLRGLPAGRHTITLTLPGYEELTRQIQMPLALPDRPYELRQLAGTVRVVSEPAGASVRFGARVLGQTPLLLAPGQLPAFPCDLRVAADGYEPVRVRAQANELHPVTVNVILKSRLGGLTVTSYPDGCDVFVGDVFMGRTQPGTDGTRLSLPLEISGLPEGDHELRVAHPLGGVGSRDKRLIPVARGKTRAEMVRLWVRDTEVVLTDGTKHYGMRIEVNSYGDVVLAVSPKKQERFLKPQIQRLAPVSAELARRLPPPDAETP